MIKWLPNAMGIDPASPLCDKYYQKVAELGMVILTHCGEEKAVPSDPKMQDLGNPLRFKKALNYGAKVIMAHCASLGKSVDLESETGGKVDCFQLFLRMMGRPEWEGLLFGDISAITLNNRMKVFIPLLQEKSIHHRLINGTDYPLVNLRLINMMEPYVQKGLITREEKKLLKEIRNYNSMVWDFCIKRTIRGPNGERFPDSMFVRNPALGI
jgi:mannonate dehydratase